MFYVAFLSHCLGCTQSCIVLENIIPVMDLITARHHLWLQHPKVSRNLGVSSLWNERRVMATAAVSFVLLWSSFIQSSSTVLTLKDNELHMLRPTIHQSAAQHSPSHVWQNGEYSTVSNAPLEKEGRKPFCTGPSTQTLKLNWWRHFSLYNVVWLLVLTVWAWHFQSINLHTKTVKMTFWKW